LSDRAVASPLDLYSSGQTGPQVLAALAQGQVRKQAEQLQKAWAGTLRPHPRILVVELLRQIASFDEALARLDNEVATLRQPFQVERAQRDSIPGVRQRIAEVRIA